LKTLVFLLALGILPVCAVGEEPEHKEYKGKSLDYWITRTQPEYGVSDRREAIRTLQQIGVWQARRPPVAVSIEWEAAAIVPTLNGLLRDNDEAVRAEAALAFCGIDRMAVKAAIPALTELLSDKNEGVRNNAASALSFKGPAAEPAIPVLVKVLVKDASPRVRHQAAFALRTAGPKGVDALMGMLDDKRLDVRRTVVGVFEATYPCDPPEETPLAAVPKLVALLQDESLDIRKSAAVSLARISDVPAEAIAAVLHHKDIEVRRIAAGTLLSRDKMKRFQAELLELMNGDTAFCRQYAGALGCVGAQSVPILMKLLDDHDPAVRANAASSLGGVGPEAKEAADALKRLLTDFTELPNGDLDDRVCHHAGIALNQILGDKDYRKGLPYQRPDGK
jgi:HEAT repeat protein